jgi:PAS domain S-box-containing protein
MANTNEIVASDELLEMTRFSLDHAADGVAWYSRDGRHIYVNDAACRMAGFSRDELLSLSVFDLDPTLSTLLWHEQWEMIRRRGSITYETEHHDKHGNPYPVEVTMSYMDFKNTSYLCSFIRDITERKRIEREIRENEQKYRSNLHFLSTLLDTIPSPVFYKDTQGNYLGCNRLFAEQILGLSGNDVAGMTGYTSTTIPPENAEIFQLQDEEWAHTPGKRSCEIDLVCADGVRRNFILSQATFVGSDATIAGSVGVMLDITTRKQTEEALRKSEQQFRNIFENHGAIMYLVDPSTLQILNANQAAANFYGYSREALSCMRLTDVSMLPEDEIRHQVQQTIDERQEFSFDHHRLASGEIRDVEVRSTLITIQGDRDLSFSIVHDITQRKQIETELRTAYQALKSLNERMQHELNLAHTIQQSLLPPNKPYWPGLDVMCYNKPAREVGGDLYAYNAFHLPSEMSPLGKYGIAVGDVSGKGMPAALLMAVTLASFHSIVGQQLSPASLLAYLDDALVHYTRTTNQNCALVYVEIERHMALHARSEEGCAIKGTLGVANAGCIMPIIKRCDGSVAWVEVGGMPLGVGMGATFGYDEVQLEGHVGDMLILSSDGLVEARNARKEMFGFERLETAVQSGPQTSAEAMMSHLIAELEAFVGDTELYDDITLLVVQI